MQLIHKLEKITCFNIMSRRRKTAKPGFPVRCRLLAGATSDWDKFNGQTNVAKSQRLNYNVGYTKTRGGLNTDQYLKDKKGETYKGKMDYAYKLDITNETNFRDLGPNNREAMRRVT